MSDYVLQAVQLCATHPGRPLVLDHVDVSVERGARVALLGANGSGKTTLLRCLSGSLKPQSGTITRADAALLHSRAGLREHRRRVQMVLQDPDDQLFSADVYQDISFGPMNLGLGEEHAAERVHEAMALLGVEHLARRATHQLSYGERKRVATAGAVAMHPDVLLLDEPTAGLDPAGVQDMRAALDRVTERGTTIVMATHDVDLALAWAQEAIVVVEHKVVQGPIAELLSDASLISRAHLVQPWALAVAARLGLAQRPTTLDQLVEALERR